ncbi:SDR family NAD(P)-dependent oxidoreductase [Streptomyces sp. SID5785]|uniref:SDR family NAD(P)-dependent oxidoreductase n=1 Tax=Streptomyces sp. SID5785 TaxID=2690309 RepID=UPI0013610FF3|nr:SDR family NAD(P)-dependent oxidoreductase [Streptomyces sp. SID5785]MZD07204.1 SDR family NAD(P)-dependent oxidoreductase [Streptomyces sp. SID5785]
MPHRVPAADVTSGPSRPPVAVVTGAGSGIGAATARGLAAAGHHVVLTGRRKDRLDTVAGEITAAGGTCAVHPLDVTDAAAVRAFARTLERVDVLVNNAGGALGTETVATADPADWAAMFEVNVLGVLHVTQALLPALRASGDGTVVVLSSTAGHTAYEGGGGYVAAKHGAHALAATLRLELCGEPVRVIEIAPGLVRTEEFALNRLRGDAAAAAGVYRGVDRPLTAEDVADTVSWAVTRPAHVNLDLIVVRPRAQAAQHKIHRTPEPRATP